jgi:hypothetical protein
MKHESCLTELYINESFGCFSKEHMVKILVKYCTKQNHMWIRNKWALVSSNTMFIQSVKKVLYYFSYLNYQLFLRLILDIKLMIKTILKYMRYAFYLWIDMCEQNSTCTQNSLFNQHLPLISSMLMFTVCY